MAISGFWLRGAKGKFAGSTVYQSGGTTVQRVIVKPTNPQSDAQMRQRVLFATASKFYSQAQQNRFALAFQNKPSNYSDFNAFMRANVAEELNIYPTKDQLNDPNFPLFQNWIVSRGNMPSLRAGQVDDALDNIAIGITIGKYTGSEYAIFTTWQEVIDANPALNLQNGDIITVTACLSDSTFDNGEIIVGQYPTAWTTRQIIIGAELGQGTLADYLNLNGFIDDVVSPAYDTSANVLGINLSQFKQEYYSDPNSEFNWNTDACMVVATISRIEGGKLRVSNSNFQCSVVASQIYTRLGYDSQLRDAIASYKASESTAVPTQVLQGALAKSIITVSALAFKESIYASNYTTHKVGDTVQLTSLSNTIVVSMWDDSPSENSPYKLKLTGTGAEGVKFEVIKHVISGAGTNAPHVMTEIQFTNFGSATQVNLGYEGYSKTLLTIKKPTT